MVVILFGAATAGALAVYARQPGGVVQVAASGTTDLARVTLHADGSISSRTTDGAPSPDTTTRASPSWRHGISSSWGRRCAVATRWARSFGNLGRSRHERVADPYEQARRRPRLVPTVRAWSPARPPHRDLERQHDRHNRALPSRHDRVRAPEAISPILRALCSGFTTAPPSRSTKSHGSERQGHGPVHTSALAHSRL
jgi:hypothetical protein